MPHRAKAKCCMKFFCYSGFTSASLDSKASTVHRPGVVIGSCPSPLRESFVASRGYHLPPRLQGLCWPGAALGSACQVQGTRVKNVLPLNSFKFTIYFKRVIYICHLSCAPGLFYHRLRPCCGPKAITADKVHIALLVDDNTGTQAATTYKVLCLLATAAPRHKSKQHRGVRSVISSYGCKSRHALASACGFCHTAATLAT
jgi:hypothetical protein